MGPKEAAKISTMMEAIAKDLILMSDGLETIKQFVSDDEYEELCAERTTWLSRLPKPSDPDGQAASWNRDPWYEPYPIIDEGEYK